MPFQTTQTKPDVVFYHSPCLDGFTAAWAIWKAFPDAQFVPLNYGDMFEFATNDFREFVRTPAAAVEVTGKHVLFVDVSVSRDKTTELAEHASKVTILDHHQSAEQNLKDLPDALYIVNESIRDDATGEVFVYDKTCTIAPPSPQAPYKTIVIFDKGKSGARLAWEWAHGNDPVPGIVRHVEDRDLWRFALPHTAEIVRFLSTYEMTVEGWDEAARHVETGRATEIGHFLEAAFQIEVNRLARSASILPAAELLESIDVIRSDHTGIRSPDPEIGRPNSKAAVAFAQKVYVSELGHALIDGHNDAAFAMLVCIEKGEAHVSLRSDDDRFDVRVIAQAFGGGGHRNAAGFRWPLQKLAGFFRYIGKAGA